MPFKKIPKRFLIETVYSIVTLINSLPRKGGVHKIISPREIIKGIRLKCPKHRCGEYVQAHVPGDNTIEKERTEDALYLRPDDNQKGYIVFKLNTKQPISVGRVTPIPMPQDIIDRVNDMGAAEKQPNGLVFGDRLGDVTILDIDENEIDEDDNASDDSYSMSDDDDDDEELIADEPVNVPPPANDPNPTIEVDAGEEEVDDNNNGGDEEEVDDPPVVETMGPDTQAGTVAEMQSTHFNDQQPDDDGSTDNNSDDDNTNNHSSDESTDSDNEEASINADCEARNLESNLGNYWNDDSTEEEYTFVMNTIAEYGNLEATLSTPQYGFNKGMKVFGDEGYKAAIKELDENLIGRNVVRMLMKKEVTKEIFQKSLAYLMFLKRKRCGKIKARGCADGRPQREYITKEESSSPTVSIYALFASCVIDAIEGRAVVTCDIPGAFLQADYPEGEDCYIRFEGNMVKLICDINPEYKKCVITTKKGRTLMFGKLTKAIYGTLRGALLFYEKLTGHLKEWGFEQNPYDECTFNKMINGEQLTVQFHVDDLKISHDDQQVLDNFIKQLNGVFGVQKPLAESIGRIHEYLGMTIDYSEKSKVKFTMYDYLEDILSEAPSDMDGEAVTAAKDRLFTVTEDATKLDDKQSDLFHRRVARLLFAAKRARPDLQTAIAFLCTRVKSPDVNDYEKLKRVIQYIRATIFIPLVLGWDESGNIVWSIDASFAVHGDMRSHTGALMTLGQGAVYSFSAKQKINTKSSTESEVVGVDDAMPLCMWARYFFLHQGLKLKATAVSKQLGKRVMLEQDNTSSIQLEKNGKRSSGKQTRHIAIRYFYVTSKVKSGEISITYCPTKEMVSDFLTKPLQGSLFRLHRNSIMGVSAGDLIRYQHDYEEAKRASRRES